jgi:peptide/nickel transport system substrate-binding protein
MKKRITAIVVGACALAIVAAGCSNNSSKPGSTPSPSSSGGSTFTDTNAQPYSALKQGGTISVSAGELTPQFNQFNADSTTDTWFTWDWYNPEVIKFMPNGDLNPNPDYITAMPTEDTSTGNTVVTYELNPKAVYNDGTPIDVTSFQNTWKMNNGSDTTINANSTDGYIKITSVEPGKDNHEVVVTFDGIYPWWGGLFNSLLNPECNTADCFNNGYVGTDLASAHPEWGAGPYKLTQLDKNAGTATFVPNDKWWGNPAPLTQVNLVVRESTAAVNAFVNGETDYVGAGSADILKQVQAVPNTTTRSGANAATYMLQLNSQASDSALSDIKVRQAIMTGIDRGQIDQVRFQGMDYTEPYPGSLLLFSFQDKYVDNFSQVIPQADPAAAMKLLEDDGYTKGSDGMYSKGGTPLQVSLTTFGDSASTKAMAQVVQTQLKAIGVDMQIVNKASSDFSTTMSTGDWEMNISGFASSDPYGVAYTCQIYCSPSDPNYSGLNKSGTGTAAMDAEIHAMEQLPTADAQIDAANKIEVEELQQYGLMPLFNGPVIYQVENGLANVGSAVFAGKSSAVGDFRENIGYMA